MVAISITPDDARVDQRVGITVRGLTPGQRVTLRATTTDHAGTTWRSDGLFVTDEGGGLDLASAAPLEGTYAEPDGVGLLWSMERQAPGPSPGFILESVEPLEVRVVVEGEGVGEGSAELAAAMLTWRLGAPGARRVEVRDPFQGVLFLPPGEPPHPCLIDLCGSDGGLSEPRASLLAAHGFATLALAYFAHGDLPRELVRIPLEYCLGALDWLTARAEVDAERLGLMGESRGGELALLLASRDPRVKAVVSVNGSGVLFQGIARGRAAGAWTAGGEELPYLPLRFGFAAGMGMMWRMITRKPIGFRDRYAEALEDEEAAARARIPLEATRAPLLLITGQDDRMWPSARLARDVVERVRRLERGPAVRHLSYEDAGHVLGLPHLPPVCGVGKHPLQPMVLELGGRKAPQARAQARAWEALLTFLGEQLAAPCSA